MENLAKKLKVKKHIIERICLILIIVGLIQACDLFAPRTPEPPDNQNTRFVPPTSADIVVSNFINSVKDLNTQNYMSCFAEDMFVFQASSDAYSKFTSIFIQWNINSEKYYFNSLTADNTDKINPKIQLSNSGFDIMTSDSAVYLSDYRITCDFIENPPRVFGGKMQLNIIKKTDGLWYIRRWNDYQNPKDTIEDTWSGLKAKYSN